MTIRAAFCVEPSRAGWLIRTFMEAFRPRAAWLRIFSCLGLIVLAHCAQAAEAVAGSSALLGLDRLIALSIRNHPSISAARAQFGATQSEVSAAKAQYYPTPSVQASRDKGAAATVVTVQQPLWAGGRLDAGLDAARSRMNAAEVSIADAEYTLALRVTGAWAAWLQARGRVEALEDGVGLLNVYTESVNRRIEGGASALVDRELVASRLMQTKSDLAAARAAERSALGRLAQLVGQPLRGEALLAVPALEQTNSSSSPGFFPAGEEGETKADSPGNGETALPQRGQFIAHALAHSAALKRGEADIETARHEVAQQRAALWPTLNLRARHQRGDATATGITTNDSSVMLVLDYTPGAGLSAGANIAAAESRLLSLRDNIAAARSELTEQVLADYEDYLSSHDRVPLLRRSIKAGTEVLASYDRLFVAGKRNWLDVINAARELVQMRALLADARAQQAATRARLHLHIGETP